MNASNNDGRLAPEQAELAVEVFRMLSDTTRVRLLWELLEDEAAVSDLATRLGKPTPAISQHLAKLRMARLVRSRREGVHVFYRVDNEHVARLVRDAVHNAEHAGGESPPHHRDEALRLTTSTTSRQARRGTA